VCDRAHVVVPVDGTSVSVVDRRGDGDLGRLGADDRKGRGLKVIDAIAVDADGTPVGLLGLTWWARGKRSPPKSSHARGARPVQDNTSLQDALDVVAGYSMRWRIEEFHRTWKRGDVDVESTQLGSASAVKIWATILATVALRIERLKRLARTRAQLPASVELSRHEIQALKLLKFGERPAPAQPTIADAVAWIAELGGFAGKYSGKPPGATVLGRGLRYLRPAAQLLAVQERCEK
jgi:hypothetical protein